MNLVAMRPAPDHSRKIRPPAPTKEVREVIKTDRKTKPQDLTLPFGIWLRNAVENSEITLSEAARRVKSDYNYLWRLSKGINVRPGYAKTKAIGQVFGDVDGALQAAGYETAKLLTAESTSARMYRYELGEIGGAPAYYGSYQELTEADLDRLKRAVRLVLGE